MKYKQLIILIIGILIGAVVSRYYYNFEKRVNEGYKKEHLEFIFKKIIHNVESGNKDRCLKALNEFQLEEEDIFEAIAKLRENLNPWLYIRN